MLTYIQKSKIEKLILNKDTAINLSFKLQKNEIFKKYPNAIFSNENEKLDEYIDRLLGLYFSYIIDDKNKSFNAREYIKEGLLYLLDSDNPYFISPTKQLYPFIANKFDTNEKRIERSIRYNLNNDSTEYKKELGYEILGLPKDFNPTNFYFMVNVVNYIKTHYIHLIDIDIDFSSIKKDEFPFSIPEQYDICNIIDKFEQRKIIQHFLYLYLGHFRHMTSISQQLIIDIIIYCLNNSCTFSNPNNIKSFNMNKVISANNIWELNDLNAINYKLRALDFTNKNAWINRDKSVSEEIFGSDDEAPSVKVYVLKVADYIKAHNLV